MGTIITADLAQNEELAVSRRVVRTNSVPAFDCFGGNTYMHTKEKPFPDLYKVFRELSKTAHWMWWNLVQDRNVETNEVFFAAANPLEAKKVSKAYTELRKAELVVRLRRQQYLINPKAVIPVFKNYNDVLRVWREMAK